MNTTDRNASAFAKAIYENAFIDASKTSRSASMAIRCSRGKALHQIRVADMPGAADLMMRIYAAMAQKERELISVRTRAALAAAKARWTVLGGDRGYRPTEGPDAAAAALARHLAAERAAHRLALEVARLRAEGVTGQAAMARALTERGMTRSRDLDTYDGGAGAGPRHEMKSPERLVAWGGKRMLRVEPTTLHLWKPAPAPLSETARPALTTAPRSLRSGGRYPLASSPQWSPIR
jgi:hypothetical protein